MAAPARLGLALFAFRHADGRLVQLDGVSSGPDVLAVGDGFPPVSWLAEARLDRYHHKVVRTGLGALFRYGNRFGFGPLRDHLVRKLGDVGIGAQARQIVLTHGANEALDLVIRYFVPAGGTVLVD